MFRLAIPQIIGGILDTASRGIRSPVFQDSYGKPERQKSKWVDEQIGREEMRLLDLHHRQGGE